MIEASLSCTTAPRTEPGGAFAAADNAVVGIYASAYEHAEHADDAQRRSDARILLVLCAASAALSVSALYFVASSLNLI